MGRGGKTEVGKLNLLCDTLRAWVSTNVELLSYSLSLPFFSFFFFEQHFRDVGTFSTLETAERVSRELSRNGVSLSPS